MIIGKVVFDSFACFFEGVVGAFCCSGMLEVWRLAPKILQNVKEIRTKGAAGEVQIGPIGYPPRAPKNWSQSFKQLSETFGFKSDVDEYFG